jgi:deazaflavin-dependent oxidoreductase (nitroreductase family)
VDRERTLAFNRRNIAEFRAGGGRLATFGDAPVLLLTTVGAATGQRRTSPMMYLPDEGDPDTVYVFASNAGAATDPAWLRNVVAHPDDLVVEIGGRTLAAEGEVLADPERLRIYNVQAALYPGFASYQDATTRAIPVVALRLGDPTSFPDPPDPTRPTTTEGAAP